MVQEKIVQTAGHEQILPTPSILLATVTSHVFPMSRFPLPTSPLNQDVATTGTSIMPPKAEARCLSVWLVVAGIRRRESLRRRFFRERSSTSRQA